MIRIVSSLLAVFVFGFLALAYSASDDTHMALLSFGLEMMALADTFKAMEDDKKTWEIKRETL